MKYLLGYLEGISDAPSLSDPDFQQLLVDVQASKPHTKSSDVFYESMERIVNDLRSTPEAAAFLKPVSKRDAPDYYQYITKPMDLSTVLRNVKTHKYKTKAEFATDLDLIWQNCLTYNTTMNHPLRSVAQYMRQKTDHQLSVLHDRDERGHNPLLALLAASGAPAELQRAVSQQPSVGAPTTAAEDEDAAGESDDAMGEEDDAARPGNEQTPAPGHEDPNGRATPAVDASRDGRATSVGSALGERRVNGRMNGEKQSPPPFRPNLQANLELTPALIRTPYTMTHFQPVSLSTPGPSFSDKGMAREILYGNAPPPWFPVSVTTDDEDAKLEGYWWGVTGKDEAYVSGLPAVPTMVQGPSSKRKRISQRRGSMSPKQPNGTNGTARRPRSDSEPPALIPSKPVSLERLVHKSIDSLAETRRTMNLIQEWQRFEIEGGPPPPPLEPPDLERKRKAEEQADLKRKRKEARVEANKRRRMGGEVGEEEATLSLKRAVAGMLAHAGFEGANEIPLDMFTRVAGDYLRNMGRTFRLLLDGFSHKMDTEEMVLHALHENGQVELRDLEAHMKDDIQRDAAKIAETQRKVRQAYKEVTTGPVIEDDMLFAADGDMLRHGDFAEDLGEDFLGLRELGIDREFGLNSLSVPKALFFGRRGRGNEQAAALKEDAPDYAPPPPFIPLNVNTYKQHVPALLHAFYAQRLEKGLGFDADDAFDSVHATIGPLGQIVQKSAAAAAPKKGQGKKDANGEEKKEKKSAKKTGQPGVGKGNWIRPSKEERERRAAEKKAQLERLRQEREGEAGASASAPATTAGGEEEDAQGEEE
ncbi:Transcriptional activator spt7 [Vanrija pseudolonga]|uniref:Transcriptional activator spt7 n=1 Tax=Vanrija pseudolonga TaxID=143232 RepID=A0AAF0YCX8_9TREE|nr:Transcriptional activator spt7 [Vanrija pseudolonga]